MQRFWVLILPLLLFAEAAFHQFHDATYKMGADIHFSPYAGGEDLLFIHRAIERIEGHFIAKSPISYAKLPSARFWRFNELFLGWLPLNYLATVIQHEVFGHGYRIRDINRGRVRVEGYGILVPPPYGPGGGFTSYDISSSLTTTEETSITMAGVESTAILAQLTKFKWLESQRIDPRQTILYLLSQNDLNLYIASLKIKNEHESGHDIRMYIRSLNYTYTSSSLSAGRLRSLSWINLADPFTYYSIFAWCHYIYSGKETKIPMIPLAGVGYLPSLRLGLTPFGPELFLENYLLQGRKPIYFYLKGGNHSENFYTGFGFYAPKIWTVQNWSFGVRLDGWWQPKLLLNQGSLDFENIDFGVKPNPDSPLYPDSEQKAKRGGTSASFLFAYSKSSGFEAEVGYKSTGFLPGYSLRAAPTIRLFYSLVF